MVINYYVQLKALFKRNLLLKKNSKLELLFEIIIPICFISFLEIVNIVNNPKTYEEIKPTTTVDLNTIFKQYTSMYQDKIPTLGFILPENNIDNGFMNKVLQNELFLNTTIKPIQFKNEDEMNEYYNNYHNFLLASIILKNDYQYTIRVNGTSAPDPSSEAITNYASGRFASENSLTDADIYTVIFSPIQAAVDQAIIQYLTNNNDVTITYYLGKLGKAACEYYEKDASAYIAAYVATIFYASIVIVAMNIVKEKELKIKDGLLMAGIHSSVFWLSWILLYAIIMFISSFIITLIFWAFKIFPYVNIIIQFLAIYLYGISCCSLGFICSAFFKKSKIAGVSTGIIALFLCYSNFGLQYINVYYRKIISIFSSPMSVGSFFFETNKMKMKYTRLNFDNMFNSDAGTFLLILIFNNICYLILAIILDRILINGKISVFSFNKNENNILENHINEKQSNYQDIQEDFNSINNEKCLVDVSHVYKIFCNNNNYRNNENENNTKKNNHIVVVNDVNFKVYENEIFGILGHNGAGKTTLLSIMVGLLEASKGDVYFDGMSISSNKSVIRKKFGVCAQTNIIYDQLTVEQHIKFYAELKNTKVDIDKILDSVDLLHQKKNKAGKLSGGQKRKLCIAMATIGNPKYIFLDEPTTGLDPLSRRKIWELLLKIKKGRVIFLTTHYMDEADILADRKLILSRGKIRCLGTSLYLKNHFNMNYNLNIEMKNIDSERQKINNLIKHHIPDATYVPNIDQIKILMDYPNDDVSCYTWKLKLNSTNNFNSLLNELEKLTGKSENKPIKQFALFMPSLEELFIRLEDESEGCNNNNRNDMGNINNEDSGNSLESMVKENESCLLHLRNTELPELKMTTKPNKFHQLICLIKYRYKMFLKDKKFAISSILLPVLLTTVAFIVANKFIINRKITSESKSISTSEIYGNSYINYDSQSTLNLSNENFASTLKDKNYQLKHLSLNEISNPEFGDPYYISSVKGELINNLNYRFYINYNDTMTHAIPATLNSISNAILSSKNIKEKISISSHPYSRNDDSNSLMGLMIAGLVIGNGIVFGIIKFGPLVVYERVNQLLQQLQLNGVSRLYYWISCFITDNSIFLISCILTILTGVIVHFEPLMDLKILSIIFIYILLWSIPTLLYQYILSFIFRKEETAFIYITLINYLSVLVGYLIYVIIEMAFTDSMYNLDISSGFFSVLSIFYAVSMTAIFPSFGLVILLHFLFIIKINEKVTHYEINLTNLFKPGNGVLPMIITLIILIVFYGLILYLLDNKINKVSRKDVLEEPPKRILEIYENELEKGNDDILKEYKFVKSHQNELPLSVIHLSKEYPVRGLNKERRNEIERKGKSSFTYEYGEIHPSIINDQELTKNAVVDVNFGVKNHECFGLLGPNGAGKSTTLNIITSTIPQTTGTICFKGRNINSKKSNEGSGLTSLGYCPQHDTLWKELTIREHIEFFLELRGFDSKSAKLYADQYIEVAGLEEHQNKRTDDLSGGTQRKLSLLIAICGYPEQILLDEPTAGMDPSTRRFIWNIIKSTKEANNSSIILTTHSMEEAEVLCDRIAILINGRLSCIGSPEYLKMKYGGTYILELQSRCMDQFHNEIIIKNNLFGHQHYILEKQSRERSKYEVNNPENIGHIFEVLEQCKSDKLVIDYSFSKATLEQVFLNFAKQQINSITN